MKIRVFTLLMLLSFSANAQNLVCEFSNGAFGKWNKGSVHIEEEHWSEGTVRLIDEPNKISKAIMVSKLGNIPMSKKSTGFGLTYSSEQMGYPMFLSVFDTNIEGSKKYFAVLSRHTFLLLEPRASQFHGHCSIG